MKNSESTKNLKPSIFFNSEISLRISESLTFSSILTSTLIPLINGIITMRIVITFFN